MKIGPFLNGFGLAVALALSLADVAAADTLSNGLIGLYSFDSQNLRDSSGLGNNGAAIGPDVLTFVPGHTPRGGYALNLDGNDGVSLPAAPLAQLSTLSVAFWLNPASQQSAWYNNIIYRQNGSAVSASYTDRSYSIWYIAGGLHVTYTPLGASSQYICLYQTNIISPGAWSHVALVVDGPSHAVYVYLNGSVIATCPLAAGQLAPGASALDVAQVLDPGVGPNGNFRGAIDDLRFYDRVLSPAEVRELYTGAVPSVSTHPGLTLDSAGALYGVTADGGASAKGCCGTVFRLTPPPAGQSAWTKATLYQFQGGDDGTTPQAGLMFGGDGGLYGTTRHGGVQSQFGTVFELLPPVAPQTVWTESVLYSFQGGGDGYYPDGGLAQGADGTLYGVTRDGGSGVCRDPASGDIVGCGTVFALAPPVSGQTAWTKTTVYSFAGPDGQSPTSGLWMDGAGALYGTTTYGGSGSCLIPGGGSKPVGCGVAFRLVPPAAGQTAWTQTVLASFLPNKNGSFPRTALVGDAAGDLYGTAELLTGQGGGTIFELRPPETGKTAWSLDLRGTVPHYGTPYGAEPAAGDLAIDQAGVLYVTSDRGSGPKGCGNLGCGAVYSLAPPAKGQPGSTPWTLTKLYVFQGGDGATGDGALPHEGLALGNDGTLYGATEFGGTGSCGTAPDIGCGAVFTLAPPAAGKTAWRHAQPYKFQGGTDGYAP